MLCDPIDGSQLDSSIPGILQARTLEWVLLQLCICIYMYICICIHTHIKIYIYTGFPNGSAVKNLPPNTGDTGDQETWVWSLDQEDPLEEEMATHSSTLAWKIPWTEEPDWLQSMGLQRVGHNWAWAHTWREIDNANTNSSSCEEICSS